MTGAAVTPIGSVASLVALIAAAAVEAKAAAPPRFGPIADARR